MKDRQNWEAILGHCEVPVKDGLQLGGGGTKVAMPVWGRVLQPVAGSYCSEDLAGAAVRVVDCRQAESAVYEVASWAKSSRWPGLHAAVGDNVVPLECDVICCPRS